MTTEAVKAVRLVYANTTKHDWPDDIWEAICEAVEAEKQEIDKPSKQKRPQNCGTGFCSCIECVMDEQEIVSYTTGHCKEKAQPNGCQLHNLHCGYPACDRKAVVNPQPKREPLTNKNPLLVFAKECVLGAYREDELADAAFKAIEAAHGIKEKNT